MATVSGKVLKPFTYKGELYEQDDEITMDAKHAGQYERLDYVKLPKAESKKVEEVQSKASATTPKPPATK